MLCRTLLQYPVFTNLIHNDATCTSARNREMETSVATSVNYLERNGAVVFLEKYAQLRRVSTREEARHNIL